MNPKVSVIIPTHNRPELLPRAIRSVFAQTFQDFELIVVDVGVVKRASAAVEEFANDPRFHYIKHLTELHGGAARNIGARLAKGEYLAFLDDDDEWLPEKLEKQVIAFHQTTPDVGFCFTELIENDGSDKKRSRIMLSGVADYREIILRSFSLAITSTLMVRRDVFEQCGGFDESLPSHQEPELLIRITRIYKGLSIPVPLVRMDTTPHEHIGSNLERRIEGRERLLLKHRVLYERHPQVLAYHYFQLGIWCRDAGRVHDAAVYFRKAFWLSRRLRYFIHAAASSAKELCLKTKELLS